MVHKHQSKCLCLSEYCTPKALGSRNIKGLTHALRANVCYGHVSRPEEHSVA